jgi:hypothetical protein
MAMNQGIKSKNVSHRSAPKVEPRAKAINPGGVGQLGASQGRHSTNKGDSTYSGEKWSAGRGYATPVGPTSLSNNGPHGEGRNVHACGTQGSHGATNPGSPRPNTYREALEQE